MECGRLGRATGLAKLVSYLQTIHDIASATQHGAEVGSVPKVQGAVLRRTFRKRKWGGRPEQVSSSDRCVRARIISNHFPTSANAVLGTRRMVGVDPPNEILPA